MDTSWLASRYDDVECKLRSERARARPYNRDSSPRFLPERAGAAKTIIPGAAFSRPSMRRSTRRSGPVSSAEPGRFVGGLGATLFSVDAVMAGLVPAIHVFLACGAKDVDARHKAGHDDELLQKA
jgi:hypothetical protein